MLPVKSDIVPAPEKDAPLRYSICAWFGQLLKMETADKIKQLGLALGFQQVGITDTRLDPHDQHYEAWINNNYHGEMGYMARNIDKRLNPDALVPGTLSVICVRMDYPVEPFQQSLDLLDHPSKAYVSRYALGRDYHKLIRKRLKQFAEQVSELCGPMGYRVFTDSAPVLEKALGAKAGLGWFGKHSNLMNRDQSSWFFLGEIYTDMLLPKDDPITDHCGQCRSCIDACPTDAIVAPYQVDARRCISYLTIELRSEIPEEFRAAIGNRIYGCDDCQLVCPWNRFASLTGELDFRARHSLDDISLLDCFAWTEDEFLQKMEGSAIRRIGYECWKRNVIVALGNAAADSHILQTMQDAYNNVSAFLQHHLDWSIQQQQEKLK